MKQEDKELLLKDLCGRLPYKIKASYYGAEEEMQTYDEVEGVCGDYVEIGQYSLSIEYVKPYLFPLSSMTEEQMDEYDNLRQDIWDKLKDWKCAKLLDWLNKNHFDYRDLIEKGLAIDATGLNIYKEEPK